VERPGDGCEAFRETLRLYGVSPTWEFLLPVVIAAQRGKILYGQASWETRLGREHAGRPVVLGLDLATGLHATAVAGRVVARGDAWEAATAFYALVGWQYAQAEAEDALRSSPGGDELLAAVREWAMRDVP